MKLIAGILLLFCIGSPVFSAQELPSLNDINHIEISSPTLDAISINDHQKISQIVAFLNQYQSGWSIPNQPVSPSSLMFSFFSADEHVTNIGISSNFISQLYGKHWSQPVAENVMKKFAGSIHPAIEENLFPIIPVDVQSNIKLTNWKQAISQLDAGIDHHKIRSFIRENNIKIKHVSNKVSSSEYWINLELSLVNIGNYVDTIIAAKIFLNQDHSLKSTQFLGYQLSKKSSTTKRITSNLNAARY